MTSNLRIDLSHKTERLRFSGTLEFEADMLFYTNLNSNCQNLPNVSYTHKGQFGKICLTKLRRKTV